MQPNVKAFNCPYQIIKWPEKDQIEMIMNVQHRTEIEMMINKAKQVEDNFIN